MGDIEGGAGELGAGGRELASSAEAISDVEGVLKSPKQALKSSSSLCLTSEGSGTRSNSSEASFYRINL